MAEKPVPPENLSAGAQQPSLANHAHLIDELYRDFSRIDRDRSGTISPAEVDAFLGRPQLTIDQQELGHFLKDNFDGMAKLTYGVGEIRQSQLDHAREVISAEPIDDGAGTVTRAVVGGAAGGAAVAAWNGDSVGSGAGKGAAVGLAIGAVAEAYQKVHADGVQKDRDQVAQWTYPDRHVLEAAPPHAKVESVPQQDTRLAQPLSTDQVLTNINQFKGSLNKIDFDNDGSVSKAELKEAVANNYLPADQQRTATVIANHMKDVVSFNPHGESGLTASGLEQFSNAIDPSKRGEAHEAVKNSITGSAVGGGIGAFWGFVIGTACGGPLVGLAAGAAVGMIGGYLASHAMNRSASEYNEKARNGSLRGTIQDLRGN